MTKLDDRNLPDLDVVPLEPDPFPRFREFVNPVFGSQWSLKFVQCWFLSRDYSHAWRLLPMLLVLIVCLVGYFESFSPSDSLIASYKSAVSQAVARDDKDTALLLAKALEALRPGDLSSRFNMALLLEKDHPEEAISRMIELAPSGETGYPPARLWLVRQARDKNSLLPLNSTQIRTQLLQVLKASPDDREAKILLAESYLQTSDWHLAEQQLDSLVIGHPELSLEVAKVKLKLDRDKSDIRRYLSDAEAFFRDRLAIQPDDTRAWAALSETLALRGEDDEARNILIAELAREEDPALRRRISNMDLGRAEELANASPLNFDQSLRHCLQAIDIDPGNPAILPLIISLQGRGMQVTADQLAGVRQWWRTRLDESPDNSEIRLILAQYSAFSGMAGEAADLLEPILESRPDLVLPQVQLLKSAGRQEAADELLRDVIDKTRLRYNESKANVKDLAQLAQALILSEQPDEVAELLKDYREVAKDSGSDILTLQSLYGQACIAVFDRELKGLQVNNAELWTGSDNERLLSLLQEGLVVPSTSVPSLQRLASLAFSDLPVSAKSKELIQKIRLSGSANSEVLSLIGAMALMAGKDTEAVSFLQLANAVANNNDPAILNNLAMAKLREGKTDYAEVLKLADSALQKVPENPDFLSTRAEIYMAMNRWQEALADLQKALPSRVNNGPLHVLLSKVFSALGDSAMAEKHSARAKELGSN